MAQSLEEQDLDGVPVLDASDCATCGEDPDHAEYPPNECLRSKRPCGHHCNCSWVHDCCHWCGAEFGGDGVVTFPAKQRGPLDA